MRKAFFLRNIANLKLHFCHIWEFRYKYYAKNAYYFLSGQMVK